MCIFCIKKLESLEEKEFKKSNGHSRPISDIGTGQRQKMHQSPRHPKINKKE